MAEIRLGDGTRLGAWCRAVAVSALSILAFSSQHAFAQDKIDLTMGIIVSPGDVYTAMTASVPERVSKATNGRV